MTYTFGNADIRAKKILNYKLGFYFTDIFH